MPKTTNIQSHQTILDIAVQEYGSVLAVVAIMVNNDFSLDDLETGTSILLSESEYSDADIQEYYLQKSIKPASKNAQQITGVVPVFAVPSITAADNIVKAFTNQNLLDISLQETGTVESIIELCLENDLSLTDMLEVGAVIKHDVPTQNIEILTHYKSKNIKPATAKTVIAVVDTHYAVSTYVDINYWL